MATRTGKTGANANFLGNYKAIGANYLNRLPEVGCAHQLVNLVSREETFLYT